MGVFTTQTLLNSVGASRNSSASAAVAINWILKVNFLLITTPYQSLHYASVTIGKLLSKLFHNPPITCLHSAGWCRACWKNAFCATRKEI